MPTASQNEESTWEQSLCTVVQHEEDSMRASNVSRIILALVLGAGLFMTACASNTSTTSAPSTSQAASLQPDQTSQSTEPAREPNPDVSPEQQALLDELLATPLSLNQVQERIKAAGYTSRVVEIDGEPQPATMDYRLDRVNLVTKGGLVTDAYWG